MVKQADNTGAGQAGLLRVLATTDLHCHLLSWDYYADRPDPAIGLSRVASLVAEARAEAAARGGACLLADNGDALNGAPLGDTALGRGRAHPLARAFTVLDYDVIGLGNHDFDAGLEPLASALRAMPCPAVCSNLTATDPAERLPFVPATVLEKALPAHPGLPPVRIGVLSVLPPQTLAWAAEVLKGRLTAEGIVAAAQAGADRLKRDGCDLVLALAHTGAGCPGGEDDSENALGPLTEIAAIDAIVAGHTHLTLPDPDRPGDEPYGKPVVMPGAHGSHLGLIDLLLRYADGRWQLQGAEAELRPVARQGAGGQAEPLAPEAPGLVQALAADHTRTRAQMAQPAGASAVAIHSYFTFFAPDRSLQLAASAQAAVLRPLLRGTEADGLPLLSAAAPGKFGGRSGPHSYTDIAAGGLSMRNIADLQVFPNELRVVLVSGAQLLDWLEMSAGLFNTLTPGSRGAPLVDSERAGHNFDVIFGVEYSVDVSQPPRFSAGGQRINPQARRIRELRWNGAPLHPGQQFAVAVNSYRTNGGGNFPVLREAAQLPLPPLRIRDAIQSYIGGHLPCEPLARAPYPWRLAALPGTEAAAYTGPGAEKYLGELPPGRAGLRGYTGQGFLELALKL
ncbi:5'-nucleotidase C-terminal domain-containing protein [Cribrihabitans neustonicus]|uniref:5'-nucleotidase C-terminal domain-containing protein n=1 Tax=Cribrihabitans neustonicus TaxID=1429085 RepID=UPI003B5C1572